MSYKDKEKRKRYREKWISEHPERIREYNRRYRQNHPSKYQTRTQIRTQKNRDYEKKYYQKHREEKIKRVKEYRENNPEKVYQSRKRWKDENKEKYRQYHREERVRKMNARGSHTAEEWELLKKQVGYTCLRCKKKEPFLDLNYPWLTEDHIVPLIKRGSDDMDNIQPLCIKCNDIKWTKIIKY